jgi:hypothetical protein
MQDSRVDIPSLDFIEQTSLSCDSSGTCSVPSSGSDPDLPELESSLAHCNLTGANITTSLTDTWDTMLRNNQGQTTAH